MLHIRMRKWITAVLLLVLLLPGCGSPQEDKDSRTQADPQDGKVSSAFRGMGGVELGEEDWKDSGVVPSDEPVEFADPATEEMLRNLIGKPEGEVLRSELAKIHAIYRRGDGRYWSDLQKVKEGEAWEPGKGYWETQLQPETLQDFALCDNLQLLALGGITVPSLAPLGSLTQLEAVSFESVVIAEEQLEELALLPALKQFGIGDGGSAKPDSECDGSFLLSLADRLTRLEAGGGIQWSPEVLSQLQNLEYLSVEYAEELSFLRELKNLKYLSLYACTATDWSPLGEAAALEYLTISGNMHTEVCVTLDDLRPLENLDYLGLSMVKMTEEHSRGEITEALPGLSGLYIF